MSIIKVENLGKKYIIGHDRNAERAFRSRSLRDTLTHTARGFYQRLRHPLSPNSENTEIEELWALRNLEFEIAAGDRVGIIGRNGAGKSTLLKVLSRITEPTTGRIEIDGRVASLLEVGTGFHPELSGRENIYLNGAILGMTRAEIKSRFDEIVAFSEIEKFLDTPVKRYSSGMNVRLAFSVAAHLEPEILIVDEVLAVGDAQFQKKCLGKMEEVGREGRTVLFVSHNMAMITGLCERGILLHAGEMKSLGPVSEVVLGYYSDRGGQGTKITFPNSNEQPGDEIVRLLSAEVANENGNDCCEFKINSPVIVKLVYRVSRDSGRMIVPVFDVRTADGTYAFGISPEKRSLTSDRGTFEFVGSIPPNFLNEGSYYLGVAIHSFEGAHIVHVLEKDALSFNVKDVVDDRPYPYAGPIAGVVRPRFDTSLTIVDEEDPS
jgi:lipopolysaccharide transport system ATP-binding protein